MTTVYVPGDAGAVSVGAGEVAIAIAAEAKRRGIALNLVRNGSRGAYFLPAKPLQLYLAQTVSGHHRIPAPSSQ